MGTGSHKVLYIHIVYDITSGEENVAQHLLPQLLKLRLDCRFFTLQM